MIFRQLGLISMIFLLGQAWSSAAEINLVSVDLGQVIVCDAKAITPESGESELNIRPPSFSQPDCKMQPMGERRERKSFRKIYYQLFI